ncbi:MAG: zraS 6 [Deltaproteobacteria bacterium]|nr:zraS 6 [Deltaproteobacteria bacterium]
MWYLILSIVASALSFGLAVWALIRNRRNRVYQVLAAGMAILGVEAILNGLSLSASSSAEALAWQRYRLVATGFLPGIWLIFSLVFSRADYAETVKKWKWAIIGVFAGTAAPPLVFPHNFFLQTSLSIEANLFQYRIGWPGYIFHLVFLLGVILTLMNLERTLRASVGRIRWQIKFAILGLGGLWGVRIYIISQTLLFMALSLELQAIGLAALVVADLMILKAFFRSRIFEMDFFPSQSMIFNSVTALLIGVYLIAVGIFAKIAAYYGAEYGVFLGGFLIFAALLGLAVFIFSDRLRKKLKKFVSLHFNRPVYNYRKEWMEFTHGTSAVTDIKEFCTLISQKISRTMEALSVTIWLFDDLLTRAEIGGTTIFPTGENETAEKYSELILKMAGAVQRGDVREDYNFLEGDWAESSGKKELLAEARIEYGFPLIAGEKTLGFLTVGEIVGYEALSLEDIELLKTMSDQTAASLLNLKLSEDLRKARELEAFQKMSTFIVHDLKNLASTLSLTLQNMPHHFDNPEFRKDAMKILEQSLAKIRNMSSSLSSLGQMPEMKKVKSDLNGVVGGVLASLDGALKGRVEENLAGLPPLLLDPEQIPKVLTNLIINADESLGKDGQISIETGRSDGWAVFTIRDNGCGMSREFMDKFLFHPFRTTKKNGMGIGLFQSKIIVEAHGGKIEVESKENVGTTFRVLLPMK